MKNNREYTWRLNDNSSSTRLKYDLEAEHWHKAFKSAEKKYKPSSISDDLAVIGLIIQLIFTLTTIIFLVIINFGKWLWSMKKA